MTELEVYELVELAEMAWDASMAELEAYGFIEPAEPFYETLLASSDEECLAFCASRDERREVFGAAWM